MTASLNIDKLLSIGLTIDDITLIETVSEDDLVIPTTLLPKLKGVSRQAIDLAIKAGKLKRVNGVLLSSILEYKVNSTNKKYGERHKTKKKGNKL